MDMVLIIHQSAQFVIRALINPTVSMLYILRNTCIHRVDFLNTAVTSCHRTEKATSEQCILILFK